MTVCISVSGICEVEMSANVNNFCKTFRDFMCLYMYFYDIYFCFLYAILFYLFIYRCVYTVNLDDVTVIL